MGQQHTSKNRGGFAKNIIAITSGKGGVGKSTVAVNLAVALAQKETRVGILDADVYGPSIPRMLGINDERLQWQGDRIIPGENFGIKAMSVGLTTPEADTPLIWRSSIAVSALVQFIDDVEWGELDYLILDMPPGTGDAQLTIAQELNLTGGIVVTTPQRLAIDDVSRAIMMFKHIKTPVIGLIENMSYFLAPDTGHRYDLFGESRGEAVSRHYEIPFLGQIPFEQDVLQGADGGRPMIVEENLSASVHFHSIVDNILGVIDHQAAR